MIFLFGAEIDRLNSELRSKVDENSHLKKQLLSNEKDLNGHISPKSDGLYYDSVLNMLLDVF